MEQQSIEGASTSDAVGFITVVQSLKRKLKNWEKNVEVSVLSFECKFSFLRSVLKYTNNQVRELGCGGDEVITKWGGGWGGLKPVINLV